MRKCELLNHHLIDAVILTIPGRGESLQTAIASVSEFVNQTFVVWNSSDPCPQEILHRSDITLIQSNENLGVSAGRNLGVQASDASFILFLDDDAAFRGWGSLDLSSPKIREKCYESRLGVISLKIVNEAGVVEPHHNPRLFKLKTPRTGTVGTFLGGACVINRKLFVQLGGFWPILKYGMEEWHFAVRAIDRGYRVFFDSRAEVFHPSSPRVKGAKFHENVFRNQILVSRQLLGPAAFWARMFFRSLLYLRFLSIGQIFRIFQITRHEFPDVQRTPIRVRTHLKLFIIGRPALL